MDRSLNKLICDIEQNKDDWFKNKETICFFINSCIGWLSEKGDDLHWGSIEKGIGLGNITFVKSTGFYNAVEELFERNNKKIIKDDNGTRRFLATLARQAGYPPGLNYKALIKEILNYYTWDDLEEGIYESLDKLIQNIDFKNLTFIQQKLISTEDGLCSLSNLVDLLIYLRINTGTRDNISDSLKENIKKKYSIEENKIESIKKNYFEFIFEDSAQEKTQEFKADFSLKIENNRPVAFGIKTNITKSGVKIPADHRIHDNPTLKIPFEMECLEKLEIRDGLLKSDNKKNELFIELDFTKFRKFLKERNDFQINLSTGNLLQSNESILTEIDLPEGIMAFNGVGELIKDNDYVAYTDENIWIVPLNKDELEKYRKLFNIDAETINGNVPYFKLNIENALNNELEFEKYWIYFSKINISIVFPKIKKKVKKYFSGRVFYINSFENIIIECSDNLKYEINSDNGNIYCTGSIRQTENIKLPDKIGKYTLNINKISRSFSIIPGFELDVDHDNRRFKIKNYKPERYNIDIGDLPTEGEYYLYGDKDILHKNIKFSDLKTSNSISLPIEIDCSPVFQVINGERGKIKNEQTINISDIAYYSFIKINKECSFNEVLFKINFKPEGFQFPKIKNIKHKNKTKIYITEQFNEIRKSKNPEYDVEIILKIPGHKEHIQKFTVTKELYMLSYSDEDNQFNTDYSEKDDLNIRIVDILNYGDVREIKFGEKIDFSSSIYMAYLVKGDNIISDRCFIEGKELGTLDELQQKLADLRPNNINSFEKLCDFLKSNSLFNSLEAEKIITMYRNIYNKAVPDDFLIYSHLPQYCTSLPLWWYIAKDLVLESKLNQFKDLPSDFFANNSRMSWELITVNDFDYIFKNIQNMPPDIIDKFRNKRILDFDKPGDQENLLFTKYAWIKLFFPKMDHDSIRKFKQKNAIKYHQKGGDLEINELINDLFNREEDAEDSEAEFEKIKSLLKFYPRKKEFQGTSDSINSLRNSKKRGKFTSIYYLENDYIERNIYQPIKSLQETISKKRGSSFAWIDEGVRIFRPEGELFDHLMEFLKYTNKDYMEKKENNLVTPFYNIIKTSLNTKLKEKKPEILISLTAYLTAFRQINNRYCARYISYDLMVFVLRMIKISQGKVFDAWFRQWIIRLLNQNLNERTVEGE